MKEYAIGVSWKLLAPMYMDLDCSVLTFIGLASLSGSPDRGP